MRLYEEMISSSDLGYFENLLNRKLPKNFPWWKKIDLESLKYSSFVPEYVTLDGTLYVDSVWAHESWKELHPHIRTPDISELDLPELLHDEEYWKLSKEIVKYHNSLALSSPMTRALFYGIKLSLVYTNEGNMEQESINENQIANFLKRRINSEVFLHSYKAALIFAKRRFDKRAMSLSSFRNIIIQFMFDSLFSELPKNIEHERNRDGQIWDYLIELFDEEIINEYQKLHRLY